MTGRLAIPRLRFRSLQARLLQGTVLVVLLVMVAVIVVVEHRQRAAIIGEVQRRGEVIARNLEALSQGPLLLYNFTALEQNVARVASETDVVYATILDAEGKVAAHSRHPELSGQALKGPADELAPRPRPSWSRSSSCARSVSRSTTSWFRSSSTDTAGARCVSACPGAAWRKRSGRHAGSSACSPA